MVISGPVHMNNRNKPPEVYFLDHVKMYVGSCQGKCSKHFKQIALRLRLEMDAAQITTKNQFVNSDCQTHQFLFRTVQDGRRGARGGVRVCHTSARRLGVMSWRRNGLHLLSHQRDSTSYSSLARLPDQPCRRSAVQNS